MTASDLTGRYLLDANGTRWVDGPLTIAARLGAICYLDENGELRDMPGPRRTPIQILDPVVVKLWKHALMMNKKVDTKNEAVKTE